MDDGSDDTDTRWLASRGFHDPVATPHRRVREERVGTDALAQIYRCVVTGAERRYGLHDARRADAHA